MKKLLTLATAAFLFTGAAYAHEGKKCVKGKECCKKETAKKDCCKKTKSSIAKKG